MRICLACEGVTPDDLDRCGSCGVPLVNADAVHYPRRSGERDATHPLIGTSVAGKYEVVGVLGQGGMGVVYRAQHEVSQVPVALKVLHPRFAGRPDHREAFLAEARKAGRVIHENCARILDVGQSEDGTVYIAMELVEGVPLSEWARWDRHGKGGGRGDAPPPAEVVEVLVQIARAVEAAHVAGIVHRDLSSNNILVQVREGALWVKVLDFGISRSTALEARRAGGDAAAAGPSPERFANPAYSAPEHLAGAPEDHRADLYSLGVIAYEALSGRLPVAGVSGRAVAAAAVRGEVRPLPTSLRIPGRLRRLVERMLATDPELRPSSAAEVLSILEAIRRPQGALSQVLAGIALAGALGLWLAGLFAQGSPVLTSAPGARLAVFSRPLAGTQPCPVLPLEALGRWEFQASGVGADGLTVDLVQGGALRRRLTLRPTVTAGKWVLDRSQPEWSRALSVLQEVSLGGPVDLVFGVPARPGLGYARLQLDGAAPAVAWLQPRSDGARIGPLRGDGSGLMRVREEIRLGVLQLLVSPGTGSGVGAEIASEGPIDGAPDPAGTSALAVVDLLPLSERAAVGVDWTSQPERTFRVPLGPLLLERLPGFGDRGPVELTVLAEDAAGNRTVSAPLRFGALDLAVPEIEAVGATGDLGPAVTWSGDQALVAVRPEGFESGLEVLIGYPDGREAAAKRVRRLGAALEVAIPVPAEGSFPKGPYRFALEDAAGNRSAWFARGMSFVDRALDVSIVRPLSNHGAVTPSMLFTDGESVAFEIRCNPAFRLSLGEDALEVSEDGGSWFPSGLRCALSPLGGGDAAGEGLRLSCPALPAGRYRIELTAEDTTRDDPERSMVQRLLLWSLPEPPALRVPVSGPHLPALIGAGVVETIAGSGGQPAVRLGRGVLRVEPPVPAALRAELWVGRSGLPLPPDAPLQDWRQRDLPLDALGAQGDVREGGPVESVLRIPLRAGRTVLGVLAEDVLGRPITVRNAQGQPVERLVAPATSGAQGAPQLLAEWYWADPMLDPAETVVRVEHGQPVWVTLRTGLPWAQLGVARSCELIVGSAVLTPEQIKVDEQGWCLLRWRLPFGDVVQAAGLVDWTPERFRKEETFPLPVRLVAPSGEEELRLSAKASRSLLSPRNVRDLLPAGRDDEPLGLIHMVPVLGPERPLPDPVPAGPAARARFRAEPPFVVRSMATFYLQDREFTREQYAQVLDAVAGMAELESAEMEALAPRLVHAADPSRDTRLSLEGMSPWGVGDGDGGFQRWVAAGPERPVTGVHWFQAYTAARLVGWLLAENPDLFRLPSGRELEWAACGDALHRGAWHGFGSVDPLRLRRAVLAGRARAPSEWPPTVEECAALGDTVLSQRSDRLSGLDLGVREWVTDLHYPTGDESVALLREWLADHSRHLERVVALASGTLEPLGLATELGRIGVVRGLAIGEPGGWVDGASGLPLWGAEGMGPGDPDRLPGVVRCEYLRRDGRGPLRNEPDPRLPWVGFRLCGGAGFLTMVRSNG